MAEDKPLPRWTTWGAIGLIVGYSAIAIVFRWWPYHAALDDLGNNPSVWQLLLANRLSVGAMRLFFFVGGLYLTAWLLVLAINNIWPSEATKGGFKLRRLRRETREAKSGFKEVGERLTRQVAQLEELKKQLEEAQRRGGKPPADG